MDQQFRPGTGTEPTTTIEISISCQNLLDKDLFSRSDPMCAVYTKPWGMQQWEEFLRTEVVFDNLNPEFTRKVKIDYRFEEEQPLRIAVYDIDTPSSKLEDHDFLGFVETSVARIVSAGYHGLVLPLCQDQGTKYAANQNRNNNPKKKSTGSVTLIAEELVELKEEVTLDLAGQKMGSNFLGCCASRIFYTMSKVTEGGKPIIIHKSEFAPGPDPHWKLLNLGISSLCNGDKDRALKLEFFKEGFNSYHTSIGTINATVNRFIASTGGENIFLTAPNGTKLSSCLRVLQCKVIPSFTFVDFIRGGTQLHCCFAIDMTGSNGDPSSPASLHYINPADYTQSGNPYQQAVLAVGEIIQEYDHTKMFPSYGFGARIPPSGVVSHKFNLSLQSATPFCSGIGGVLETYRNTIPLVQLFGPTCFAPIIREAAAMALQNANGPHYYVLLIITDGIINDMDETTQAIVNASTLPLSIIIVGVGAANFDAMDELDGDTVRLSYNGRVAARDIVQFVPYRDAYTWISSVAPAMANQYNMTGADPSHGIRIAKAKLAQEVLAEIPAQLTGYMKSRGIVPGNVHNVVT